MAMEHPHEIRMSDHHPAQQILSGKGAPEGTSKSGLSHENQRETLKMAPCTKKQRVTMVLCTLNWYIGLKYMAHTP